ncbi:TetR/AcrR family transcriptional regulator [Streptomyces sp. JJ36]|uniref:TetR/AcrR family transcriptional regulator n=1 Tax=Streptomyces sp. JJ36 TaxID=2736645 RepID=UPI001F1B37C2|nr:TetR/AcrR family transcriptional regulator [Streptomyces sp. JJ36]MCF6524412.1 TetR/AcrR family transcriptional regulator [Streptomyces sp. JJ36]
MSQTGTERTAPQAAAESPTRTALLEAALDVFAERGYADASVTEIATRSGSPVGSLFQHYGGKRGLYLALWEDFQEKQEHRTAAVLAELRTRGVDDPVARFVAGARAYLEGAWEQRRIGRLLSGEDGPPGFDALRRQWDRSWVRRNSRLLRVDETHRAGRVRVRVLTTVIGGAGRELADCADEGEAREIVDEVCGILARLSVPGDHSGPEAGTVASAACPGPGPRG